MWFPPPPPPVFALALLSEVVLFIPKPAPPAPPGLFPPVPPPPPPPALVTDEPVIDEALPSPPFPAVDVANRSVIFIPVIVPVPLCQLNLNIATGTRPVDVAV